MASDRSGQWRHAAEALVIPIAALAAAMAVFGVFMAALGQHPLKIYALIYKGAFASAFSWQNTLSRAAPLILTALCVALPAQAGLMVIGGEGAVVLRGLTAALVGHLPSGAPPAGLKGSMMLVGLLVGGAAGPARLCRGRRHRRSRRRGRGGRGPRQRERLADRGLRLRRHRRRVHRPPESAGDRAGRGAGRGPVGLGWHAAAPPRPARCHRARPAAHRLHADPRQRSALRPAETLPSPGRLTVVELGWWGVPLGVEGGAIMVR